VAFLGSFKDPGRDTHKIEWDFGDGATADGTLTPSHSYAQPGSYVVRLTVTDHDQAASTDTLKVVVADSDPPPTADAGPDVQAIEGTPVSFLGGFEDAGPGTSHKLVWTFGDGSGAEGRLDPSHAYADDGRYLVTLTVTDEGGHKGSDTLWVTVANAAPSAKLTLLGSPVLECAGAGTPQWRQITISHTDAGTADTHTAEVAWGNGLAQALGAPPWMVAVPHYPRTGAFTVAGHVADDDGGTGSDSLTLQVVDTVPPAFAGLLPATSIPASDPKGTPFDVPLPQVTDACGSALVTSDSPGVFPVGITKVTFTASDDAGNTATASTTVTVTNRPPVPAPATLSTVEDVPLGIRLEASDPDGHALQFKLTSQPAHGKLSGNPPLLAYAPDKDWNGTDEFSFSVSDGFGPAVTASVSIKVQAVNDPPFAASSTYTISEDTPLAVKLGGSDVDSDKLALQPASAPAHGTLVTLDGDTSRILYTPAPNWSGTDSFQFIVFDGERSATGTIQIIVAPVDDAPVALAQQLGTREGVPVQIMLAGADVEGGALTFLVTQGPVHGALSGAAPRLTYTPAPGFSGTDTFFFATSDGSSSSAPAAVVVTVTADPDGRMHGDGHVEQDDARHSFDFRAFEHAARERGRLSYTRRDDDRKRGKGKKQPRELDRFQATRIDVLAFSDDSLTKPGDRKPPAVDTVLMAGVGTWNGEAGYAFEMTATDAGEPGRGRDRFLLVVTDPEGFVVARVDGTLDGGNVQSKRLAKGWR
jgi:PKD repeat protein